MAKKNPLSEGIVGRELISYFVHIEGVEPDKVPVDADCLSLPPHTAQNTEQVQYRITFADGSVSDWLVTFEDTASTVIISAEQFNEVL